MKSDTSPWTIRQRCSADWEKMRGDDKRRFCEHCKKFVHNVSAITQKERKVLAEPASMGECVFYYQRPGGKIADLAFLTKLRRWIPFLRFACWSAFVALLPFAVAGCWCMGVRVCRDSGVRPIQPDSAPSSAQGTNQTSKAEAPQ